MIETQKVQDFQDLDQVLIQILQLNFGMQEFRKGQVDILRAVSLGRDTLAVMPTGGGKSLCYQLPSKFKPGIVLVISPLIALMKDQVGHLNRLGIAAGALHSGQDDDEKRQIFRQIATERSYILYVSPERTQFEGFATWIAKQNISLFAIDEAHCMSQWGPDFRPDYHKLTILRQIKPEVPILALTATATPLVLKDIESRLGLRQASRHVYGFYRSNLYLQIVTCESDEKLSWVSSAVREQVGSGRAIIYCGTRKQAAEVSAHLKQDFEGVGYYHAGLSPESRERIQKDFESGKLKILAATNAFGMGIDRPDVRLVIHYQMPSNIENYYQEIGRAGRDGLPSTALLLYSRKDKGLHSYFIQKSDADEQAVRLKWRSLDTFIQFIESDECRFAGILTYFRDTTRTKRCGHCDICLPQTDRRVQKPAFQTFITRPKKSKKTAKSKTVNQDFNPKDQLLMELLKDWRKAYAEANDIPAFMVFSNKTMDDLISKKPKTAAELELVYGIGPKKVEHLGEELLKVINFKPI